MELTNACEIQETADGGRRRARGKAGPEIEVQPQRRIAADGRVDERNRAAKNGENEAQGKADAGEKEKTLRSDSRCPAGLANRSDLRDARFYPCILVEENFNN